MKFGIYIHWPFCVSKCPYCDFNSHVQRSVEEGAWLQSIQNEISYYAPYFKGKTLTSIFFGGGTPSLMAPKTVEGVINHCINLFGHPKEITLEANPNSVEVDKFKDLNAAGVNRISIGVQSFNEADLKFLGRQHSVNEAKKAIEIAQSTFKEVSFDLIYALGHQSTEDWKNELSYALSWGTNHLSLYQLTIEPGTLFEKRFKAGDLKVTDKDHEFYALTHEIMQQGDFHAYEVSNYAKVGHECQHNLIYWRYQPFMGCGPGAHGRLHHHNQITATQNFRSPKKWIEGAQHQHGAESTLTLTPFEKTEERLLMGLRLLAPLTLTDEDLCFISLNKVLSLPDFIIWNATDKTLTITPKGRLVLDAVLKTIVIAPL